MVRFKEKKSFLRVSDILKKDDKRFIQTDSP